MCSTPAQASIGYRAGNKAGSVKSHIYIYLILAFLLFFLCFQGVVLLQCGFSLKFSAPSLLPKQLHNLVLEMLWIIPFAGWEVLMVNAHSGET